MIEAVRREVPEKEPGAFARAVGRLVDLFGAIQGEVTRSLVESRGGGAAHDPVTGLPGPVQLDEWLHILLAEQRRYGHTFALALVDVDGLGRINEAHGRPTGDRMLTAVAGVLRRQLRDVDQAFRLEEDEFAVLAPHTEATGLVPMADAHRGARRELAVRGGAPDRDRLRGRHVPRGRDQRASACSRAPRRRRTPRRRRGSRLGAAAAPVPRPRARQLTIARKACRSCENLL